MGMSITVLLSYAVYLSMVADKLPETSLQVGLKKVQCYLFTLSVNVHSHTYMFIALQCYSLMQSTFPWSQINCLKLPYRYA